MNPKIESVLARGIRRVTGGSVRLAEVVPSPPGWALVLEGELGRGKLEIRENDPSQPAYQRAAGYAFTYGSAGVQLTESQRRTLDSVIALVAEILSRVSTSQLGAAESPVPAARDFPSPHDCHHLESDLSVSPEQISAYRRDGYVILRNALAREVLLSARPILLEALRREWPKEVRPVEERQDAYSQAFVQVVNPGVEDEAVRVFSQARRLGKIAADLMDVSGVRIFSEDWLIKEPGARLTPWHQDATVFPLDTQATCTIWIPLQEVTEGMGLLRYARGSQIAGLASIENINDISEEAYGQIIREHGFPVDDCPPFRLGDISVHDGRMIHGAYPNDSGETRVVLALHCFADGAVVKKPETPIMAHQLADHAPDLKPGDAAVTRKWPLTYSATDPSVGRFLTTGAAPAYHLRGTQLPEGGDPLDLWIQGGRIRLSRPDELESEDVPEVGVEGGFFLSGLVDVHSHVSWPHDRSTPSHAPEFMNANRANYAATGVTCLRDMGSAGDEVLSLVSSPGLPRILASGRLILRHEEFPFTPVDPENLREAFLERISRGARWIKVFTDWSSDYQGKENTGFTGQDEVTYPLPILADAVAAAHAAGARVAAHCFTGPGTDVAIEAGCDSLEHGWAVQEAHLSEMVRKQIAWVPLLGIAAGMWKSAKSFGEQERVTWVEECLDRLARLLPEAHRRGVAIFAGTDWFPEVTVADEIRELHELGLPAEAALAAGSWAARKWLGLPGLEDGAPADLLWFRKDPRLDLAELDRPALILVGGKRVDPRSARVRPVHVLWGRRQALIPDGQGHG